MARPQHAPTPQTRQLVEALTGYGASQEQTAKFIGLSENTLRRRYRKELAVGTLKASSMVAANLFKIATSSGPGAVTAAIFWLKSRAGWAETTSHEIAGKDRGPIQLVISADDARL
jgi:hypothetical protein